MTQETLLTNETAKSKLRDRGQDLCIDCINNLPAYPKGFGSSMSDVHTSGLFPNILSIVVRNIHSRPCSFSVCLGRMIGQLVFRIVEVFEFLSQLLGSEPAAGSPAVAHHLHPLHLVC